MKLFSGIDIGQKGAIAIINEQNNIVLLEDFPTKNTAYIMGGWVDKIYSNRPNTITMEGSSINIYCVKEEPIWGKRPGLGGTYRKGIISGINIGRWEHWLDSWAIESIGRQPRTWQKIFPEFQRLGGKERSAAAAIREMPGCEKIIYGPRGGLKDGRADAILLSIFCKLLVDRGMFR